MSPIEHIWDVVDRRVGINFQQLSGRATDTKVDSTSPNRKRRACIDARGGMDQILR